MFHRLVPLIVFWINNSDISNVHIGINVGNNEEYDEQIAFVVTTYGGYCFMMIIDDADCTDN